MRLTKEEIARLFVSGSTHQEISELAFVSRQRVQQVLKSAGLRRCNGGAWLRETQDEKHARQMDARCRRMWHISHADRVQIKREFGYAPFHCFQEQRSNSKKRGVPFLFTFQAWWKIWLDSGHWLDRRKGGYVMSRHGDTGAYEPRNVSIITQADNMHDWMDRRRALKNAS